MLGTIIAGAVTAGVIAVIGAVVNNNKNVAIIQALEKVKTNDLVHIEKDISDLKISLTTSITEVERRIDASLRQGDLLRDNDSRHDVVLGQYDIRLGNIEKQVEKISNKMNGYLKQ